MICPPARYVHRVCRRLAASVWCDYNQADEKWGTSKPMRRYLIITLLIFMPIVPGCSMRRQEIREITLSSGGEVAYTTGHGGSNSVTFRRDGTAEICREDDGQPEPDPPLRDTENMPLCPRSGPGGQHQGEPD